MKLSYYIDKIDHKVILCKNKEAYDIKKQLKRNYSDKKVLIIIDKNLNHKFSKYLFKDVKSTGGVKLSVLKVNASKANKTEILLFKILDILLEKKFTKKSVIISCGGGVIGDVSALASSLYLRGLTYYHIPTTMTAIVDSCIGGKTGINYKNIINSVGNYYHPKNVFISKNVINLIPNREFFAGIPEILKCGVINDTKILSLLENNREKLFSRNYIFLKDLIFKTLKTKIKYFKNDIYENSSRLKLNFGHTFAHAIEMALQTKKKDILRHGEAVGMGMLCEIFYTGNLKLFEKVNYLLRFYNLPTNLKKLIKGRNQKFLINQIYKNIFLDKKRINNYPRCIKINKIGDSKIIEMKDNSKIKKTIKKVLF